VSACQLVSFYSGYSSAQEKGVRRDVLQRHKAGQPISYQPVSWSARASGGYFRSLMNTR
jgi:hypothetical protein